jgi:hypothetical protein
MPLAPHSFSSRPVDHGCEKKVSGEFLVAWQCAEILGPARAVRDGVAALAGFLDVTDALPWVSFAVVGPAGRQLRTRLMMVSKASYHANAHPKVRRISRAPSQSCG